MGFSCLKYLTNIPNVVGFSVLILWTWNTITADWSWDIVHDVLFARVNGPVFYYDHAFSFLVLSLTGWIMVIDDRFYRPWREILAVSAVVGIHELVIESIAVVLRFGAFDVVYSAIMIIIVCLALLKCTQRHKRGLLYATIFTVVYQSVVPFAFRRFGESINGFIPTAHFLDPITNLLEVLSWLVPFLLLLFASSRLNINHALDCVSKELV